MINVGLAQARLNNINLPLQARVERFVYLRQAIVFTRTCLNLRYDCAYMQYAINYTCNRELRLPFTVNIKQ